ncbi:MAG: CopD family protein [Bdellovibrionales bacterium]|nr:CopD family protein [Bdellovibrionales bacterium]
MILVVKALHVVSFVSWFAALLYGVRLFIYHSEALSKPAAERGVLHAQFQVMERRLWLGIGLPASILTVGFGLWLAGLTQAWSQGWLHVKLLAVTGLLAYHHVCGGIRKRLSRGENWGGPGRLRLFNELGTVFLVGIVFLAVTREPASAAAAVGVFLALGAGIFGVLRLRRS